MRSGRCDGERPCSRCQTAGRACSDFSGDNELAILASDTGEGTISIHNHNSNTNTMGVFVSSSIPCTSTVPIYGGYLTPMTAGIAGQDLDAPYDFDPTNVSWESNSLQTPGGTYLLPCPSPNRFLGEKLMTDNLVGQGIESTNSSSQYDAVIADICMLKKSEHKWRVEMNNKLEISQRKLQSMEEKSNNGQSKVKTLEQEVKELKMKLACEQEQSRIRKRERDEFESQLKQQKASFTRQFSEIINSL
jgi:hypothetical protein